MEAATFRNVSYAVARATGAQLLAIHEPGITPNFYSATLSLGGRVIHLLCSIDNAWAFSTSDPSRSCSLEFVDSPVLSVPLHDLFGIRPMSSSELLGPFSPQPGMTVSDIRYWKPKSLGEGMFHWWD